MWVNLHTKGLLDWQIELALLEVCGIYEKLKSYHGTQRTLLTLV